MYYLKRCCYCLPLKFGCIFFGVMEVINWTCFILFPLAVISYMKSEPNEDEENKTQRLKVLFIYIFMIVRCIILIAIGIFTIIISSKKLPKMLKRVAVIVLAIPIVHALIAVKTPWNGMFGRNVIPYVVVIPWYLYFAVILFSYGEYLEDTREGEQQNKVESEAAAPPENVA